MWHDRINKLHRNNWINDSVGTKSNKKKKDFHENGYLSKIIL